MDNSGSTDAPGGARRLDSLSRGRSGGTGTARGTLASQSLRYKPKTQNRRSAQERERLEREERDRLGARRAQDELEAGRAGPSSLRGRGWTRGHGPIGGRGGIYRGFAMEPPERIGPGMASGPFGAGSIQMGRKGIPAPTFKREGTAHLTSDRATLAGESSSAKGKRKGGFDDATTGFDLKDETGYALNGSSDDSDGEAPRVDIELINLVSDDEEADDELGSTSKANGRSQRGLRPIRLDAQEHVDRGAAVTVDAQWGGTGKAKSKTGDADDDDGLFVPRDPELDKNRRRSKDKRGDVEFIRDARKWKGVYHEDEENGDVQVKSEPRDEADTMVIEDVTTPVVQSDGDVAVLDASQAESAGEAGHRKGKQKARSRVKSEKQPVLQTEQDRFEWTTHEQDIQMLTAELGRMPHSGETAEAEPDEEGDVNMTLPEADRRDVKFGRLYLLQFPPVLPGLYNPIKAEELLQIPKDSGMVDLDPDPTEIPDSSNTQSQAKTSSAAPGNTGKAAEEVILDDSVEASGSQGPAAPRLLTALNTRAPGGRVGKLRVHASGRVILTWGDENPAANSTAKNDYDLNETKPEGLPSSNSTTATHLQVHRGTDAGFLQDIVFADIGSSAAQGAGQGVSQWDGKKKKADQIAGLACAIAPVAGKFVITPDWAELLK